MDVSGAEIKGPSGDASAAAGHLVIFGYEPVRSVCGLGSTGQGFHSWKLQLEDSIQSLPDPNVKVAVCCGLKPGTERNYRAGRKIG